MIKVAVCDDDEKSLMTMTKMLEDYQTVPVSADCYRSGEELLAAEKNYDIIMLDIDMKGMNGIDTAGEIRKRDRQVKLFYVTSYSDYMIFAFAVHAFAYLLKPVKAEELYRQLDEAVDYGVKRQEKEMEFLTREGIVRLKPSQISFFECYGREVVMHTESGEWHLKVRLADVAERMKTFDFVMPHKSFLINLSCVLGIHGYDIRLTDGSRVPLSQKKSVEFRKQLNEYLAGRRGDRL